MKYKCQVCKTEIDNRGYIEEDTGVSLCSEHYDEILDRNMLDARFTLSRVKGKVLVLDLQGTQACAIQHNELSMYYSVMSDLDLYEAIYGEYYDVLTDLGLIGD